ncbi:MAG: phenylalanine--tRNA ligase subunit alpha, partial [Candidatus Ratteibacteria bacterium]
MDENALLLNINKIVAEAMEQISKINDSENLEEWRIQYFGRKGIFASMTSQIPLMPAEIRPQAGALINSAKRQLTEAFEERKKLLTRQDKKTEFNLNFGLPGLKPEIGSLHPVTLVSREIVKIFQ